MYAAGTTLSQMLFLHPTHTGTSTPMHTLRWDQARRFTNIGVVVGIVTARFVTSDAFHASLDAPTIVDTSSLSSRHTFIPTVHVATHRYHRPKDVFSVVFSYIVSPSAFALVPHGHPHQHSAMVNVCSSTARSTGWLSLSSVTSPFTVRRVMAGRERGVPGTLSRVLLVKAQVVVE